MKELIRFQQCLCAALDGCVLDGERSRLLLLRILAALRQGEILR